MKLYTAPQEVPSDFDIDVSLVFLAGSIEEGTAALWQTPVIKAMERFSDDEVVLFNPRRTVWDPMLVQLAEIPVFLEQVNWELDQLELADIVFFYFQAGTKSPVTMAELGKILERRRFTTTHVIVVCEPGFWRYGNVDIMCMREGIDLHHTLEGGIAQLIDLVQPE